MKAVIGIDVGSSGIKAMLLDSENKDAIHVSGEPLRSRVTKTPPGHFEENPNILREQVFGMVRELAMYANDHGAAIEALGFTGQMHGGLIVDKNLEPLTNCITWQDKRGDEISTSGKSYVEELAELIPADQTGVGIKTGFLISSIYWLKKKDRIPEKAYSILGIYDWLQSMFVGRAVTDISSAAAWGMFDPIKKSWRSETLHQIDVGDALLPEVAEPGVFLGLIDPTIATQCELRSEVRIYCSIGDTQAAYLGSECKSNEVLLNFGTGSQSMWETGGTEPTPGTDIRYLGNDRYLACAPTLAGGEAYGIAANFFREIVKEFADLEIPHHEVVKTMDRLALNSHSDGITFDPIFQGSKFRNVQDRASIAGIDPNNFHPSNVVRALVEGMIEEIAKPFFLRKEQKVFTGLVGEGTALRRNQALQQVAERRFELPMRLGRFSEAASAGAAFLCL